MDLKEIQARIGEINQAWVTHHDAEAAHGKEDDLFEDFIRYIAKRPVNEYHAQKLAKALLKSKEIGFPRLCS